MLLATWHFDWLFQGDDEDDQLAAVKEAIGDIPETLLNRCKNRNKGDLTVNGRGKAGSKPLANMLEGDDLFKDTIKKVSFRNY